MIKAVAVVLAAGASSRLGRPKQLLEFESEPLIRRAARIASESGCTRTIVVWGAVSFTRALEGLSVELVENPEWEEGIASSIRTAVRAASGERILFTVADQPLITAAHLRLLVAAAAPIVATAYEGAAGVPAAFAPILQPELLALRGDRGARNVIEAHRGDAVFVPFARAGVDVDSEEDYRMLLRRGDRGQN